MRKWYESLRQGAQTGWACSLQATSWPLAGDPIWYEDAGKKHIHRDLVQAGMERARLQGKPIGRPKVTARQGFADTFAAVLEHLDQGVISRRKAADELSIGYATLKRLLDARQQSLDVGLETSAASSENQGTKSLLPSPSMTQRAAKARWKA